LNRNNGPCTVKHDHKRVLEGGLFPALSKEDAPIVESSWKCIKQCVNELETRQLAYSTLGTHPFGQFPSLPTLDAQYCSQLRLLIRESMIVSLLKAASQLEQFARDAEHSCANFVQLLNPMYASYECHVPTSPRSVPLAAYPLEFSPPEVSWPPWGQKVMVALNEISITSSDNNPPDITTSLHQDQPQNDAFSHQSPNAKNPNTSNATATPIQSPKQNQKPKKDGFQCARDAVSMVVNAFQQQDDEEQTARLERKNVQVMDRLAKMQAHKRACVITIRDSYGINLLATKAADEFHSKASTATATPNQTTQSNTLNQQPSPSPSLEACHQVPLLKCGVLLNGSTGTCYITAYEILFITQLIPLLGEIKYHLVSLQEIELVLLHDDGGVRGAKQNNKKKSIIPFVPAGLSVQKKIRNGVGVSSSNNHNNINIKNNDEDEQQQQQVEMFSFIPSIDARRFQTFVDMVRQVGIEDPDSLRFSSKGGLLCMFDDLLHKRQQQERQSLRKQQRHNY